MNLVFRLCIILTVLLVGCSDQDSSQAEQPIDVDVTMVETMPELDGEIIEAEHDQPLELEWDNLIPNDWRPDKFLAQYNLDEISDDDPRAAEISRRLKEMYDKAPTVESLDNTLVKIPGFFIPLEMDGRNVTAFLLVPYMGACIHTPPPPANQTIYVRLPEGLSVQYGTFEAVWVIGTLKIERIESSLQGLDAQTDSVQAGYIIEARDVHLYE